MFISHDDVDHTGNVNELMDACPNATLIVNWFMTERMGASLAVPPTRQRWIGDGESFDVGDRTLHAVRPPIFDSPTTRGLFDPTTGVYWASDSFATPMLTPVRDVAEIDAEFWADGMDMFDHYVSPWLEMVDEARFQATVDRVEALAPACSPVATRRPSVRPTSPGRSRRPGARRPRSSRPSPTRPCSTRSSSSCSRWRDHVERPWRTVAGLGYNSPRVTPGPTIRRLT